MCFKAYLNHPINKKKKRSGKKNPKAITVLKNEGGLGPTRKDHDHGFNGFFDPFPKW